jgi:hypothetical protein
MCSAAEREERPMSDYVKCILVGGEYHVVRETDSGLPETIGNLTEQCDNCGSSGSYVYGERPTRIAGMTNPHPGYSCIECGSWYEIQEQPPSQVVF